MKIKKHQLFLWISLAVLAVGCKLSFIEIIIGIIEYDVPPGDQFLGIEYDIFCYLFLRIPVFLLAASFIASVYQLLKYIPHGAILICWLMAAILSASAIVFQVLTLYEVLDFPFDIREDLLLLTSWPVIIVSFVLRRIHKRRCKNEARIALFSYIHYPGQYKGDFIRFILDIGDIIVLLFALLLLGSVVFLE